MVKTTLEDRGKCRTARGKQCYEDAELAGGQRTGNQLSLGAWLRLTAKEREIRPRQLITVFYAMP